MKWRAVFVVLGVIATSFLLVVGVNGYGVSFGYDTEVSSVHTLIGEQLDQAADQDFRDGSGGQQSVSYSYDDRSQLARTGSRSDDRVLAPNSAFSSGSRLSNSEIIESGAGLSRTASTVDDVAGRAGLDLLDSTVRIIDDPEYIRYLDSQGACACAPYDLPGEIHLGPASFVDEETLAATIAHELEHLGQYRGGWSPGSRGLEAMEALARAAEGPAVSRLRGGL